MLVMRHDTPHNPTQRVLRTSTQAAHLTLDGPSRDRHPIVEKHEYSTAIRWISFWRFWIQILARIFSEDFSFGHARCTHITVEQHPRFGQRSLSRIG